MIRVLLTTEGTYPFVDGGVTTWCSQVVHGLPGVGFTVYAVTGDVGGGPLFDLPPNVDLVRVPSWGVEHPVEWGLQTGGPADLVRRRVRVRGAVARGFADVFAGFLGDLARPGADPRGAARRLVAMHRFFMEHDFPAAMTRPETWRVFMDAARTAPWAAGATGHDVSTALSWLRAFLMPLAVPVPPADLTHATIAGMAAVPGVIARIERGTPLLVTEHGVYLRERYLAVNADPALTPVQRRFMLALAELTAAVTYAHADVVAPVCDWNARWERRLGVPGRVVRTIHNGVDPGLFTPRDKPPSSPGHGRPTAVAAARVFPLKDIETMIRAAARTREIVPDALFLVYGSLTADPPYVRRCRRLIDRLGLEGDVVLAGLAPEPTQIFNQGDIGVLSSVSEAFPYTILEALACGRPVAATDVGGVRELLEGWGELVPPRDPAALGEACARLLLDGRRRGELGRRGRERVLARFRASIVADRYADLYARMTAGRPRGGHRAAAA